MEVGLINCRIGSSGRRKGSRFDITRRVKLLLQGWARIVYGPDYAVKNSSVDSCCGMTLEAEGICDIMAKMFPAVP
jgi:hypothetical protein